LDERDTRSSISSADAAGPIIDLHPLLYPGSTRFNSSEKDGLFSVSQTSSAFGSTARPEDFLIPYAKVLSIFGTSLSTKGLSTGAEPECGLI
jgi:hypothetical protein